MLLNFYLLCLLVTFVVISDAARILAIFPTPSISHQVVFRPLTQELAIRGHEVVVITTDLAFPNGGAPENLIEIDVHNISYSIWNDKFVPESTGKQNALYIQFKKAFESIDIIFEKQMQDTEVKKIFQGNKKFDLLLLESWVKPLLSLSHVFKAPVILISSFGAFNDNYHVVGASTHFFLNPKFNSKKLYNLTLWDKATQLYSNYVLENVMEEHEAVENAIVKRIFGPDTPSLSELNNNVHMLFVNCHPIMEGNQPIPPAVVHIWGIHQTPEKELPQDLKSYLDSSKNGVIYMSFGTNTDPSLLPPEKIQMFVNVFSKLPYDVLWKWNADELPGRTKNIRISKWLPQADLLRHPNIKLFITQGGLQSTDEAIMAEVPLLGIPMLGDQWLNTEKYVYHNIGMKLDFETLNEEELRNSIETIIGDNRFRKSITRLHSLLRDQPQSALDRAVFWVEHVLRHGGARHLRAPAANMSWIEYYELKLVGVMLLFLLVAFGVILWMLWLVYKTIVFSSLKLKKQ